MRVLFVRLKNLMPKSLQGLHLPQRYWDIFISLKRHILLTRNQGLASDLISRKKLPLTKLMMKQPKVEEIKIKIWQIKNFHESKNTL